MNRRVFVTSGGLALIGLGSFPLTGCTDNWIQIAIDDIPAVDSVVSAILGLALAGNPIVDVAVQEAIKIAATAAQVGLTSLSAIISAIQADPSASNLQKAEDALMSVSKSLSAILAAGHIDNPGLQATIANGVALGLQVMATLLALIPAVNKPKSTKWVSIAGATSNKAPKLMTASEIKHKYSVVAMKNGYAQIK